MLIIYPGKYTSSQFIFLVETTGDLKNSTYKKLEKVFNLVPPFMRLPRFTGIPQPVMLLRRSSNQAHGEFLYCAAGLWRQIVLVCERLQIQIDTSRLGPSWKYTAYLETQAGLRDRVRSWGLSIEPRDYQLRAAWLILKYRLSLSELATRAGKTLIFYIVARAALETLGVRRILLIVPSLHLVKQGVRDLNEYGSVFRLGQVCAGQDSVESDNLVIGTFQSLVKRPKEYFEGFDLVCVDEAHRAPSRSISTVLERIGDKMRFGFSGSLPPKNTIPGLTCQALLGPCIQQIRAEELIENGYLATPKIINYYISYNNTPTLEDTIRRCGLYLCSTPVLDPQTKKPIRLPETESELTIEYQRQIPLSLRNNPGLPEILSQCKSNMQTLNLEVMLAERSWAHLKLINELVNKTEGNVIVFAHHTSYIKYLSEHLRTPKKIHVITGSVPVKKREQILRECEQNNNIIIGSYGCISTGLTFRNIQAGILAQSFKSEILNKQTLGRLMLRQADKECFYLYDIIDYFPDHWTAEKERILGGSGKLIEHVRQRIKLWRAEGYEPEGKDYVEYERVYEWPGSGESYGNMHHPGCSYDWKRIDEHDYELAPGLGVS